MTIYSYLRTSTSDQLNGIEVQRDTIATRYQTTIEVVEHASGKNASGRPLFTKLLSELQPGDKLVVSKLDRFARSVTDALTIMTDLAQRGVGFVCLDMDVDTSTPVGRLVFTIMSAFAEFERNLISERTTAGLAVVRANGQQLGKPSTLDCDEVYQLVHDRSLSIREAAEILGTSKSAVQRCLKRSQ